ncbi:MAG: cardiolipin synthase [Muribaculaceae bacterium]|nr:cardiolipin synthase [Muribaculaceae bacterium]
MWPFPHIINVILLTFYIITILTTIGVVISENRNPVKSLAWVTVLILLPVLGLFLYLFFGRSPKNMVKIPRRNRRRMRNNHLGSGGKSGGELTLSGENRQLAEMAWQLLSSPVIGGNAIEVFTSGKEKFEALKADLLAAREYIHLQYYIFENDKLGREIRDILVAKVAEGVKVRVIYDHVGSFHLNMSFFSRMRKAGVEIYPFLKVTFPEFANHVNWRNHRKVVVIDGKVGYIGGMNIADRYVDGNRLGQWRDTHLRVTGGAVEALAYSFAVDWYFMRREEIFKQMPQAPAVGDIGVQLVMSGPVERWSNIAMIFLKAISSAKKTIYLETPYFLPSDSLLKALQAAALSGVDVRVMIPRNPDSRLLRLASASYIKECLQAHIKIYFYDAGMLHSKLIVVDDEFVTTGSTNFDFRSFEHNFEGNLLIYSHEFNKRMRGVFHADLAKCTRVNLGHWKKRPVTQKALESLARLMAPIL